MQRRDRENDVKSLRKIKKGGHAKKIFRLVKQENESMKKE